MLLGFFSCKKEDVSPDYAPNFVGSYKGAVNDYAANKRVYAYQLFVSSTAKNVLEMTLVSNVTVYEPSGTLIGTVNISIPVKNANVNDGSNFNIGENVTETQQAPYQQNKYYLTGRGRLSGNLISAELTSQGTTKSLTLVKN